MCLRVGVYSLSTLHVISLAGAGACGGALVLFVPFQAVVLVVVAYLCHQSCEFYCQTGDQTKICSSHFVLTPFLSSSNVYACACMHESSTPINRCFSMCLRFAFQHVHAVCSTFVKFTLELRKLMFV